MCPSSRAHPARRRRASVALTYTHTTGSMSLSLSLSVCVCMSVCVCVSCSFPEDYPACIIGCGVALLDSHVDWMKLIWEISSNPSTEWMSRACEGPSS